MSSQLTGSGSDGTTSAEFGANEWLVDEMYERFLADPQSVDETWRPVLEHYRRVRTGEATAPAPQTPASMPDEAELLRAASESTDGAAPAPTQAAPAATQAASAQAAPAPAQPAAPAAPAEPAGPPAEPAVQPATSSPSTAPSAVIGQAPAARTTSVAPRTAPVPADVPVTSPQPKVDAGEHGKHKQQRRCHELRALGRTFQRAPDFCRNERRKQI